MPQKRNMTSMDRVLQGFDEFASQKPKPPSIRKKVLRAGIATIAGLMICTGFGLMIAASPSDQKAQHN